MKKSSQFKCTHNWMPKTKLQVDPSPFWIPPLQSFSARAFTQIFTSLIFGCPSIFSQQSVFFSFSSESRSAFTIFASAWYWIEFALSLSFVEGIFPTQTRDRSCCCEKKIDFEGLGEMTPQAEECIRRRKMTKLTSSDRYNLRRFSNFQSLPTLRCKRLSTL